MRSAEASGFALQEQRRLRGSFMAAAAPHRELCSLGTVTGPEGMARSCVSGGAGVG